MVKPIGMCSPRMPVGPMARSKAPSCTGSRRTPTCRSGSLPMQRRPRPMLWPFCKRRLNLAQISAMAEQILPADPLGCCGVSGLALAPGGCRAAEGSLPLCSAGPIAPGRGMFLHGFVWSVYSDRAEWSGYSGSLGWQAHSVGAPASLHHHDTDPKQWESPHLRIIESALDL